MINKNDYNTFEINQTYDFNLEFDWFFGVIRHRESISEPEFQFVTYIATAFLSSFFYFISFIILFFYSFYLSLDWFKERYYITRNFFFTKRY
jgi:hypothetical protein